ncbi:MAG TPA: CaiB/BaiF CoA-transferase family protein [Acidimicrobiia bacterium]|nr:CaiB/BaiF CoA-transferase family protein [Acidimicrobiia bacterium]
MSGSGASSGPLAGIRVLDLSIAAAGPYATAMLADQGADVVKVERPGIGDIGRWVGIQVDGISALYQICNRGKRCIAVNLDSEDGRDLVRRLAATSDVVVQNWRPGVAERLGVGYDDVRRDDLVYVSISGFGDVGPYAGKGAYDTVIQAYGGMGISQADPETGEPRFARQVLADKVTAITAAQAITAALLARERGRGGQHVKLSMLDALVSFLWVDAAGNQVLVDGDGSQPGSFAAGARPFRFTDGWAVATPTADADFFGMCRAFGVDGYDDPRVASPTLRQRNPSVTRALVERCHEAAATMTTAEGMARMEAERVPCGVVLSPAELVDDPHARAVGLFVEDVHPVAGRVRQPRHPARFGGTPAAPGAPAPTIGADTDEVLKELGLGDRIADLRAAGIVA